jgi:sec-independent protein translocase protein TatA
LPFGIGPLELIVVLVIVLLIFGPKRLPGLGRSLGSGMREFKDSITGKSREEEAASDTAEAPPQLPRETADR